jgi:hypothetical protein
VAGCGECGDEPSGSCSTELEEVRWDKGDTGQADNHIFFRGDGNADYHLGTDSFCA